MIREPSARRVRRVAAVSGLLLLALGCAPPPRGPVAQAAPPAPPPLTGGHAAFPVDSGALLPLALRERTFDVAWRRVRDGFFDPAMGGVNWDSVREFYRPRALAVERSRPFHDTLARMLATLAVSHTAVLSPERLAAERTHVPGWTGVEARRLPEGWVLVRVGAGSPGARAGLHAGDVVDSIGARSAEEIAAAGDRPWLRPSDRLRATTAGVEAWLAGTRSAPVVVVVHDTLGARRTVRMKSAAYPGRTVRIGNLPPARAMLEVRRLARGVGYIRFTAFVPDLEESIRRAIRGLRSAPGLIIDLRGNPGGYDRLGDHIAELLVREPTRLTETRLRHGVRLDEAFPSPDGYRGPVAVLLDGLSASAAEQFAAPLQEIGRVVVVGERSAGADLEAAVVALPTGAALMYPSGQPRTPAGRVIEGAGVAPDVEVTLTRAGLARGHDAQLEAALAALQRPRAARR